MPKNPYHIWTSFLHLEVPHFSCPWCWKFGIGITIPSHPRKNNIQNIVQEFWRSGCDYIWPELIVLLTYNSSFFFKCGCPLIPLQVPGRQQYTYNAHTHLVDFDRMSFRCDGTLPIFSTWMCLRSVVSNFLQPHALYNPPGSSVRGIL